MSQPAGIQELPRVPCEWPEIVLSLGFVAGGGAALFVPMENHILRYLGGIEGVLFGLIGLVAFAMRGSYRAPSRWTLVERWEVPTELWRQYLATTRRAMLEAAATILGIGLLVLALLAFFTWLDNPEHLSTGMPVFTVMLGLPLSMALVHQVADHARRQRPASVWVYREGMVIGRLVHAWRAEGALRSVAPAKECDYPALEFLWVVGRRGSGKERAPIPREAVEVRDRIVSQLAARRARAGQPPPPS